MGNVAVNCPSFLVIRDGFYRDPDAVREIALRMEYFEHAGTVGYSTEKVYHEPGIRNRIERILGIRINRWDTDPAWANGVFYTGFSGGIYKEEPSIHFDEPVNDITVVVYLTPDLPPTCGTSLWRHKATDLTHAPTRADARRLGKPIQRLRDQLERDSDRRKHWAEIDRAGYKYNRMVAYKSGMLHSASRHIGSTFSSGRVYQIFRVGVEWSRCDLIS